MRNVYVVCEGQTEANFVKKVLIPAFCDRISLIPRIVVTSRDLRNGTVHKGGGKSYGKAFNVIKASLKEAVAHHGMVTTMFDFYAMPKCTPGKEASESAADAYQKVLAVEDAMLQDVEEKYRYLYHPYIQLHEFEALVFCNLDGLKEEYFDSNIGKLQDCLVNQPNPELINTGESTAPSRRIIDCIPDYDKVDIGVKLVAEAGLDVLRENCKHFGEWLSFLEAVQ